ncbi:pentatricopeptide repeat-containing protein CRR2, chloroplastic-like [Tasmannia lanceolata]|uniref:pentatricopeptide repeat-containing protein CRR2, chloroplastic-like n=1 Tax=Tasmannia lanceolata TaxID=3420 RepID=UPI004064AFE5
MWAFCTTPSLQLPFPPKSQSRLFSNTSLPKFSLPFSRHSPSKPTSIKSSSLSASLQPSNNNHLIQSLCKKGNLKQALQILSAESNPTQQTYERLILACTQQQSLSDGLIVHQHLIENGFDQDPFLATKLISMYSQFDSLCHARQVFDKISNKTIFVWNALIRALALAGEGGEALALYQEMYRIGVHFDRFTYPHILKACVVSSSLVSILRDGKEIHGHIFKRGFESQVYVATTLVDVYAKFGCVSYARCVFDGMLERNVVSWSAMIGCYAKNERPFEALELFLEMMVETDNAVPNAVTMVSVLQACGALAALGQGKLIHAYILRRGLNSIVSVSNALLTMYVKSGSLEAGRRVFEQMCKKDIVSWNSMISGYGIHGFGADAIRVFEEMIDAGISPNPITFVSVLGACSHVGLVEEGKRLFEFMVSKYRISPHAEHYACMVDLLGRAGQLEEAAKVIETMRIEPGPTVWGSLLGACRIHSNVELAERASLRLFKLEPTNAGNYVLLADIYTEAKMWEDVNRVKKLLEARGLQKVPGCSRIEVKKKVYSFVSVDELNPQIVQLHALLVRLSKEMKERGYIPDTKVVLYELDREEKEQIVLGHSEKLAVAFGLINSNSGETIRITKNLRLCEDCHSVTKFISEFTHREIIVRDVNRVHHFRGGVCSCADYW